MRYLNFGQEHDNIIVLVHASCMTWDFFEKSIEKLAETFHVIVPVLPGYDMEDSSDYTSVEEIATEIEAYLLEQKYKEIQGVYGISMGGSVAIRMLTNGRVFIKNAIIDGGITPYQLPKAIANLFVLRDFSFMMTLKNSLKCLSYFVSEAKYGSGTFEKLRKVMLHASTKTIWNNFKSCNTYTLPEVIYKPDAQIYYWYGSKEKWNRKRDVAFVRKLFPNIIIEEMDGLQHAEFVMTMPDAFANKVKEFMDSV